MQRRRVEAGEHHVLDDHDLDLVVGVLQPLLDRLVLRRPTHVLHHRRDVGRCPGVDDLDLAGGDVVGVPIGPKGDDRGVEVRADLAGRPDDQRLAGPVEERAHGSAAVLPVRDQVLSQRNDPLRGAVDGVDDRDALLDAGALDVVETLGELVGDLVEVLLGDTTGEGDLDEPRLEVHGDGGAVVDGATEVVDVDVVAEHLAGIAVVERDRRAGERDHGRPR